MPDISKNLEGKKYMWDGHSYDTEEDAKKAESSYKEDNFETRTVEEDGKYLVYTRRVVTEVVVEGAP